MNYLYLGDCYDVLKHDIQDESVDLIYIDPPFNSKRNYNMFFDDDEIKTQRVAFEDTWTLKNIQYELEELNNLQSEKLYKLLMTYSDVAPHAFPYLTMMSLRIIELHRVLKDTGSFYLHCDPNMSHYLKTICDLVFGYKQLRNEIVWCYRRYTAKSNRFQRLHDIILFYGKSADSIFNTIIIPYKDKSGKADSHYKQDENGKWYRMQKRKGKEPYKVFLSEGVRAGDWWDISHINSSSKERLGYPTQKPKKLLERIVKASSKEGDVVLDGFCGCGTTVDASEGLNRKWIGIDVSPIAISLMKRRLENTYGDDVSKYDVRGIPTTEKSAIQLWKQNPFAFQDWWVMEYDVMSMTEGKKGADKGLDGIGMYDIGDGKTIKVGFQVKGGKSVQSKDIDALMGSMKKFDCELGVFLSTASPTKPMLETITNEGFVELETTKQKFPRLQIQTLHQFFSNERVKLPSENITFKKAGYKPKSKQTSLL
jgi:site-specific DNA-methyltransferase (adenine-specific)